LAQVLESIAIDASRCVVFGLVRDQARRHQFLPAGWRILALVTDLHDDVGATMDLELVVGPRPVTLLMQTQESREHDTDVQSQLVEAPPAADNYITTWTVRDHSGGSQVFLHVDFSYGGAIGEFFASRRLRRACREMLQRLKVLAEAS
jgi:ribosome-associated toxin RatA of RatAB toxin-antitoxin module